MTKILKEQEVNDDLAIVVLKREGEPPYTQIIPSKLNRIQKLQKYIRSNHGGKKDFYQEQLDALLENIELKQQ